MEPSREWFCALLDTAPDVYFRYAVSPERRLVYISPAIRELTGHAPADFYADPKLCFALIAAKDRRQLRQAVRLPRGKTMVLHVLRDGLAVPVEITTVALVKHRTLLAIEGVLRLAVGAPGGRAGVRSHDMVGSVEPTQQRLAALMFEVHDLLHRVLPASRAPAVMHDVRVLGVGELVLDLERLTVTESGQAVVLTTREVMLLRYLLQRAGRVVTRQQLLTDVWDYRFTGDDRTVDVHISRLRRKLPSIRTRLVALRHIGYRLDVDDEKKVARG